jgi:hypothetical protein
LERGTDLLHDRRGGGGEIVDEGDCLVEQTTQPVEYGGGHLFAEPGESGLHVRQRAGERGTGRQRRSAESLLHRVGEGLEVDLSLAHHFADLGGGEVEMLREQLEDGHAGAHELEHVVALKLAARRHGTEYGADVGDGASGYLRGVRHGLQDVGQLTALLDAGRRQAGGHGRRVTQAERRAFHRGERVVHDFGYGR